LFRGTGSGPGTFQEEATKERSMQDTHESRKRDIADPKKTPPAGPHAKEKLTDREKTPGTGSLPEKNEREVDVGPD
jgi:hypothetical protein